MLPVLPKMFALFRSPFALSIGYALLIASFLAGAYIFVDSRATARAERACSVELQFAQSQMLHDMLSAQEEAHQYHLAEIERGEQISAELAKTQRRLNETKTEYLAYANSIVGHCPDSLRVFMSYPAPSDSGEASENPTTSTPPHTTATVDASLIATNIAVNRWAFEANYAQCSALLEWFQTGTVK